jgi:mannitol PTS system EIICBA or EIICB component
VCEAGMGSSVMGQSILKRKLNAAGLRVDVGHAAVSAVPVDAQAVVVHRSLEARVREAVPKARVWAVDQFIKTPVYDEIVKAFAQAPPKE